ncbi:MAG: CHAT domain-containing protein [Bacteroidetes bacterium]|nr:MAG: CHAT domain-containing protein [Bacteroidota bacterium]
MMSNLEKAIQLINELEFAEYFSFMENLVGKKAELTRLQKIFITGKTDVDFYEQLKVLSKIILKENTMKEELDQIKKLIIQTDKNKVLDALSNFIKKYKLTQGESELLNLQSDYQIFQRDQIRGVLSAQEASQKNSQLSMRVLNLIELLGNSSGNTAIISGNGNTVIQDVKVEKPKTEGKKTILFLASSPSTLSRMQLGKEHDQIQDNLQRANMRDFFDLEQQFATTTDSMMQSLLDKNPYIVHFSGHGTNSSGDTNSGGIYLENGSGDSQLVNAKALEGLFKLCASHVKCVILNACYSETQAKAIGKNIEYVVGMNKAILDTAALHFSVGFYKALGAGRSVEDAFESGRVKIDMENINGSDIPQLLKNGLVISV